MPERVSDERLAWLVREMGRLPEPHDTFDDELLVCLRELQAARAAMREMRDEAERCQRVMGGEPEKLSSSYGYGKVRRLCIEFVGEPPHA